MEMEGALAELRCARERLDASERSVESLRAELSDMAAQRDHTQAELHQARLQAAQLTLQLADAGLALREGRASWAQDREALRNSAEVRGAAAPTKNNMTNYTHILYILYTVQANPFAGLTSILHIQIIYYSKQRMS